MYPAKVVVCEVSTWRPTLAGPPSSTKPNDATTGLRQGKPCKSFTVRCAGCAPTPRRRAEDAHLGARRGRRGGEGSVCPHSALFPTRPHFLPPRPPDAIT